jgi:PAS domain-containing protein
MTASSPRTTSGKPSFSIPAAERIFGYSADDVVGVKDARDYLPQWVQETLVQPA